MAAVSKAAQTKSAAVRAANAKIRQKLSKKHKLAPNDFMPMHIMATLREHNIPVESIPATLLKTVTRNAPPTRQSTGIPLDAIAAAFPRNGNGKVPKKAAKTPKADTPETAGAKIALAVQIAALFNKILGS